MEVIVRGSDLIAWKVVTYRTLQPILSHTTQHLYLSSSA
jgi:hypothetical protein